MDLLPIYFLAEKYEHQQLDFHYSFLQHNVLITKAMGLPARVPSQVRTPPGLLWIQPPSTPWSPVPFQNKNFIREQFVFSAKKIFETVWIWLVCINLFKKDSKPNTRQDMRHTYNIPIWWFRKKCSTYSDSFFIQFERDINSFFIWIVYTRHRKPNTCKSVHGTYHVFRQRNPTSVSDHLVNQWGRLINKLL